MLRIGSLAGWIVEKGRGIVSPMHRQLLTTFLLAASLSQSVIGQCSNVWVPESGVPTFGPFLGNSVAARFDPDGAGPQPAVLAVAAASSGSFGFPPPYSWAVGTYAPATDTWTSFATLPPPSDVACIHVHQGRLLLGGTLALPGGQALIAEWNGTAFVSVVPYNGQSVAAMATAANGDLVIGGSFASIAGVPANHVARWDGSSWSAMGTGPSQAVMSLCVRANGDILASGGFTQPSSNIVRWTGSSWQMMGTPPASAGGGAERMLELSNGDLLAAGTMYVNAFNNSYLMRWTGSNWAPFSSLLGGYQQSISRVLELPGGDLLFAGNMNVGGSPQYLCRWNGSLQTIAGAPTQAPGVLVRLDDGDVYPVLRPGGVVLHWSTTCPATAVSTGSGCPSSGGNNQLEVQSAAWVGDTYRARATGLPAQAIAVSVVGFSGLVPALPLSAIFPQAQAGCFGYAAPDQIDILSSTGGTAAFAASVPATAALVGVQIVHQMLPIEIDASLSIVAVTATNALTVTIGKF